MRGQKIEWTEWRDDIIRRDYHHVTREELAKRVGVSVRSVTMRARVLGIGGKTYAEMLEDDRFREFVSRRIVSGLARSPVKPERYFEKHSEVGAEYRFRKGHRLSPEAQRRAAQRKREVVYDELVRMKYGLPRRTRIRLKKRLYIDKRRYFPENGEEKQ